MSDATTDRLHEIQQELAQLLESRLAELDRALQGSEAASRRLLGAEIELQRHRATAARLEAEVGALEGQVADARTAAETLRGRHAELTTAHTEARDEQKRLEEEVAELDAAVEQTRQSARTLESEQEELRSENAALKTKLKTLEENITRMQRLKEELMSSISGLTAQMSGIAGGDADAS